VIDWEFPDMSLAIRKTLRIERVNSEAELLALKEPWTALLADVPGVPIFLTWEWISTWWRHYGQGQALWVLAAWDEAGRLAGLAPWMLVHHRWGPLCLRRIAFIGSGLVYPDHLDVIARPDEEEAVCAAFVAYLETHQKKWDVLDLEGLARDSVLKPYLATAGGRYREREAVICPVIFLADDWDTYQKDSLSRRRRQNLRRRRRRLEQAHPGQVAFHRVAEASELPSAMDALIALHRKRWLEKGLLTSFSYSHFVAFHREMAALALERGWLRLYQLKVADQVIAVEYCFRYRDAFYDYQKGFDPDWHTYGPGNLLLAYTIQEAIKEGVHEFDMLRGTEPYKLSWTDVVRTDSHLLLSTNWPGHLWLLGAVLFDATKLIGKRVLPQPIQLGIERWLSTRGR
jgi:CelD/BcsL family acetyltransferase involved in cellulose biosynthesis